MKPLALFINLAGPIQNPEHGIVHQCEIGITIQGGKKPEATQVILKTGSMSKAIEMTCELVKKYVAQYYPKQAGNGTPPENVINITG
jgi:hypothetical protein